MAIDYGLRRTGLAVTDTLRLPADTPAGLIDVITVAPLVGDAMQKVFHEESVSGMFR